MTSEISTSFSIIREEHGFDRSKLPDSTPRIVITDQDLEDLFNIALQNWNINFDREFFLEKLAEYLTSKPKARRQNQELRKYLKDVRKAGHALSSAHHFCKQNPDLPKAFAYFLRYLGKANDAYEMEKGNKFAKRVEAILENEELNFSEFDGGTVQEYEERIEFFINRARELLSKKRLPIPDYHRLRKDLRHFMNLYQIAAARNPTNLSLIQIFQYLQDLNSDLGHIHDEYVILSLENKIDYESGELKIPKNLRRRLENFYEFLED